MTREEAIKFLSNTKVYVNEKSKEVQEKLFSLGFEWPSKGKQVIYTEKIFMFIFHNMIIGYCNDMEYFIEDVCREITVNDILNIVIDEPKYRPFKDAEECWQEMLKHQPFGWIQSRIGEILDVWKVRPTGIMLPQSDCGFNCALNDYVFADGTPFGVKEEEEES